MGTRRLRGAILRLAFRRRLALLAGVVLVAASFGLGVGDYAWEGPWTAGLGMLCGATGVALVLMALGGRQPDWEE